MKPISIAITAFMTALLGLGTAWAVETGSAGGADQAAAMEKAQLHSASQFIGLNVQDSQGQPVGVVRDLVLDMEEQRIAYLLVGVGEESYLVPWAAVTSPHEGPFLTLDADRQTVTTAPVRSPEQLDEQSARELHEHYGVSPYWDEADGEFSPPGARKSRPWADLPGQEHVEPLPPRPPLGGSTQEVR